MSSWGEIEDGEAAEAEAEGAVEVEAIVVGAAVGESAGHLGEALGVGWGARGEVKLADDAAHEERGGGLSFVVEGMRMGGARGEVHAGGDELAEVIVVDAWEFGEKNGEAIHLKTTRRFADGLANGGVSGGGGGGAGTSLVERGMMVESGGEMGGD